MNQNEDEEVKKTDDIVILRIFPGKTAIRKKKEMPLIKAIETKRGTRIDFKFA